MNVKSHGVFATLVVLNSLLASCGPSAEVVYGRASNPDRKVRGLPIIPDTWIERGGGQADWGNPEFADPRTTNGAMHTSKFLILDKLGDPSLEYDCYQSGKKYISNGGDPELFPETLTITYDFKNAKEGKNPWHCEVDCGPLQKKFEKGMTLDEAEAVLKDWGLKRLNY